MIIAFTLQYIAFLALGSMLGHGPNIKSMKGNLVVMSDPSSTMSEVLAANTEAYRLMDLMVDDFANARY
jgi:hypothetical protein